MYHCEFPFPDGVSRHSCGRIVVACSMFTHSVLIKRRRHWQLASVGHWTPRASETYIPYSLPVADKIRSYLIFSTSRKRVPPVFGFRRDKNTKRHTRVTRHPRRIRENECILVFHKMFHKSHKLPHALRWRLTDTIHSHSTHASQAPCGNGFLEGRHHLAGVVRDDALEQRHRALQLALRQEAHDAQPVQAARR